MNKQLLILLLEADILEGVLSWPIRELGAKVLFYKTDAQIKLYVQAHEPDVVLLDEPCGGPMKPHPETLAWLKQQCRSVRVVWDATDTPWHGYLEAYKRDDAFHAVIAADGATDWPHREGIDWSFPTAVDPSWYDVVGESRSVRLGFSGSCGTLGPRKDILGNLQGDGTLKLRPRLEVLYPYSHNADFYKQCQAVLNVAHTSSGRLQCKARAIEAALAGCLLFETRGSPTEHWLTPGIDYVEYDTPEDVRAFCNQGDFTEQCRCYGKRARAKVLGYDFPRMFWSAVMGEQL